MNQHKLSLIALSLAALLAWSPEASAQRSQPRGSSRPSAGAPSSPSRGGISRGSSSPSRPSVSSPSQSSSAGPSTGSSRSAPPSSSSSRSSSARGSSSSSRTITIAPSPSYEGRSSSSRSGWSSSESRSSSSGARTYGLPSGEASVAPSADPARSSGPSGSRGLPGWSSSGDSGSSPGWSRSGGGSSGELGSGPSSSSSGDNGRDSGIIYAAPRRVPFPSPAGSSGSERSSGSSSSSLSSRSGSNPFGTRSSSGPSASRFGLDRGSSERGAPTSARTLGERGDIGPGSARGSSRSSDSRTSPDSGGLSSRTRSAPPGPSADRNAILDRYRRTPGASGERSGPSTGRSAERGDLTSARRSGPGLVSARDQLEQGRGRAGGDSPRGVGGGQLGKPGRGLERGYEDTRPLRDLTARDPGLAREVGRIGRAVGYGQRRAFETGWSASLGLFGYRGWGLGAGYWDNGLYLGFWGGYGGACYSNYGYWWAVGGYPYSYWCHPFSYPYYCYYGYWPRVRSWYPSYYYPAYYSYPAYTASVITRYVYDEPAQSGGDTYVYVNGASEQPYVEPGQGEAVAAPTTAGAAAPALGPDSTSRATGQYLTLGDQAFRDGRFADAVHFYARAVQFSPDDGVLWLVLSDGLFATGDYHYGAFSLRKALELDPTLAQSAVDKRGFYTDATEFDRQLAVLEGFVQDHPGDADALLVLAANYLFGGRPAAAVDLLEEPRAEKLRGEPAGSAVLEAARAIQYGR